MADHFAIEVRGLRKAYGELEAVRGIDFSVPRGQVFGLLGPNGAGKTTTVEILEGYRQRSAGAVSVLGEDPAAHSRALRQRIGIVLQSGGIYSYVTPREALRHWASFYPNPREVDEVLALAGLEDRADVSSRKLSGGQLRRLDFALALVGDPELIFLDEPTTGFDPEARRSAWETVRNLRDLGKTILLTTHYLDEAQELADRVAIVKDGRILAIGAPPERGVLQLPAPAAVSRRRRRDPRRQPAPAQPADPRDRRDERDGHDVHRARVQHRLPPRARRAQADPRHAPTDGLLLRRRRRQR